MIDEARVYRVLGERLRQWRERFADEEGRLTQARLAQRVGLERTSITNIENGAQKVPLHVLFRLCEVLRISVTDLVPTVEDVQHAPEVIPTEEVRVGAVTVNAGPLLKNVISRINTGESL